MRVRIEADVGDDSDPPLAAEDREAAALREPVVELAAMWVGEGKRRHAHQPPATSLGTVGPISASRTSAIAISLVCLRRRRDRPSISTFTGRFSQIATVEGAVLIGAGATRGANQEAGEEYSGFGAAVPGPRARRRGAGERTRT